MQIFIHNTVKMCVQKGILYKFIWVLGIEYAKFALY